MQYRSRSDCPGSARAPGRAGCWARPGFQKLQECILCRIVHGAVVRACHMFAGLGEPCFDKLEAMLAHAMLSIPSTKGFVLGSGFEGTKMRGSGMQYNQLTPATSAPGLWAHRGHICTGTVRLTICAALVVVAAPSRLPHMTPHHKRNQTTPHHTTPHHITAHACRGTCTSARRCAGRCRLPARPPFASAHAVRRLSRARACGLLGNGEGAGPSQWESR